MKTTDRESKICVTVLLVFFLSHVCVGQEVDSGEGQDSEAQRARAEDYDRLVPKVVGGLFDLPPLFAPSIATDQIGNGRLPDGFRDDNIAPIQPLPESASQRGEPWNWSVSNWAAANTFSYPRYYEDRMLERHGQERWGKLQPVASGARFFVTPPMLPYLMAIRHPCDCEYTMGFYRPGSCAPAMLQRPPLDRRAVIVETAAVAGAIIAFP